MSGRRILAVLGLLTIGAVALTLWPSDKDLDRRYRKLDQYREQTTSALAAATELVRFFDALKPIAKKKQELGALKQRAEELENKARSFRDQEGMDRVDARQGLEQLEETTFELMRDAEDLVARLREMKRYKELLDPISAETGRLTVELAKWSETNTDVGFAQRVNQILESSKTARALCADGQQQLTSSIVQGRTICEAARKQLEEVNQGMRELIEEAINAQSAERTNAEGGTAKLP